jgi:large subunit ribosomal protein L3
MSIHGMIGKKIGTTQVFRDDGRSDAVTVIQAGPCTVTQIKTEETDGYIGVQLGYDEVKRLNRPESGHLKDSGKNFRVLREFGIDDLEDIELGQQIDVSLFEAGELVDATAKAKGRGFQGGVKRYNFKGGPKTHGQSDRHRAPGSIGAGTTPGKVIKGLRMAGHMGDNRVTVRKLEVVESDPDRNLLFVKGAVPGARDSLVLIKKSGTRKRKLVR